MNKHTHTPPRLDALTDKQIQAAIDAAIQDACSITVNAPPPHNVVSKLTSMENTLGWPREAPLRLALAKSFLTRLAQPASNDQDKPEPVQAEYYLPKMPNPLTEPAWIEHDGGPCQLKDEEVERLQGIVTRTERQINEAHDTIAELNGEHKAKVADLERQLAEAFKTGVNAAADSFWSHPRVNSHMSIETSQVLVKAIRETRLPEEKDPHADNPATFEAHGFTWNRHTPGDPMPCDGKNEIFIIDFDNSRYGPMSAEYADDQNWWSDEYITPIIGWRYAALDSGVDGVASLLKNRFDPDDERVRIRRVAEDDAILHDIQTAQAEIVGLREALGNLIHDCKTHATDINDIRWGYEGDGGTKLSAEQILEVCEAASKALASPPPPVITVDEAVRRIQGVTHGELISDFTIAEDKGGWDAGIEAVRARLIASTHDGASGGTKV